MSDNQALQRIKELCEAKGWSIYKLAAESKIPYSTLKNSYKRDNMPNLTTLTKLCRGLNISLSDFFAEGQTAVQYLSEGQKEVIDIYDRLDADGQKLTIAFMKGQLKEL